MVPNSQWFITTVSSPVMFNRGTSETWYLNPARRYVLNARHVEKIKDYVDTLSELPGSAHYRPLNASQPLVKRRVFVERFRDRGIGDLLFLTGPFAFMQHISGNDCKLHVYAYSDRGQVLQNLKFLEHGTAFIGPTHYYDFIDYDAQWLVNTVTESSEEPDQLNVYDALYRQIGINPAHVEPRFKRPYVEISESEERDLTVFFHSMFSERQIDLRQGYFVLAPLTHSALRVAPYGMWLGLAAELALRRPVIFVGQSSVPLPDLDMAAGEFLTKAKEVSHQVLSIMNHVPTVGLRSVMALISKATAFVGLDSGLLYAAQACRVPAVSLWGPHDPGVRIGYDRDCMDLAVWNQEFCHQSPCFAYGDFPARKCPLGEAQKICQCLAATTVDDVLSKVRMIESKRIYDLGIFTAKHEQTPTDTAAAASDTAD